MSAAVSKIAEVPATTVRTGVGPRKPAPRGHRAGDVLAGRYQLLSRLGEGGMGSVWKARCAVLDVEVAVKVVKRASMMPDACQRLLREARAAASLSHPSIVRVFDFGTSEDGDPFLVMEYLKGKTLRAWLEEQGRVSATTAVQLMLPLVSALAEVHDFGLVHRDIKPENIILEDGPRGHLIPILVDFGLAKQSGAEQSTVTQAGALVGSPAYMSPEQALGKPGPQSDIWSLCVVLYELVTGRRPFVGANRTEVLCAVFEEEPEPTYSQAAGDIALWEILRRGLAKKKAQRWPSMKQLGRELAAWAVARGVVADAASASICHQWLRGRAPEAPVDDGQPLTVRTRQPERAEVNSAAYHVHTMPVPSPGPGVGLPPWNRRALGAAGAALLMASLVTFLVLSRRPAEAVQAVPQERTAAAATPKAAAPPAIMAEPTVTPSVRVVTLPEPPPVLTAPLPQRPVKPAVKAPPPPEPRKNSLPLPLKPDF